MAQLPTMFSIYTDAGFDSKSHVIAAHHGPAALTAMMKDDNFIMAKVRISPEWGFGMVKQVCPFVARSDLMKLELVDVSRYVRNAFLMANVKTMLRGNICSLYYECDPPSLAEYFV